MNAAWHQRHPMPPRATLEQRLRWHVEHAEQCGCRKMPPKLAAMVAAGPKGQAMTSGATFGAASTAAERRAISASSEKRPAPKAKSAKKKTR